MAHALRSGLRNGGLRRGGLHAGLEGGSIFNIASLDLNFARYKNIGSLVTFTRASSGTFVGSDGVLRTAVTNLLLRSEEFDNASWAKVGTTVSANSITSPNGALTADTLVEDTSTGTHRCVAAPTIANTTVCTVSVYAKAAGRTHMRLSVSSGLAGELTANLSNGTVAASSGATNPTVQSVGDGWYRVSFTTAASTSTSAQVTFSCIQGTSTTSYTGDGTSGIYIWGAQVEAGAFPTSYIPTTTAAATRSADVASITAANFSSWYNQTEGTLFFEGINPAASTTAFAVSDGSTNNRLQMDTGTNTRVARVVSGGTTQASNSLAYTYGASQRFAMSYVTNSINFANAGTLGTEDTSATIPTVDQARIGANPTGANPLNNTIKRLTYFPTRLPNSTLQSITQ